MAVYGSGETNINPNCDTLGSYLKFFGICPIKLLVICFLTLVIQRTLLLRMRYTFKDL